MDFRVQGAFASMAVVDLDQFIRDSIEKLRQKLLDLTTRNPLLRFRHSAKSRRHVRAIDELPNQLFARLESGAVMRFKSLGDQPDEPLDEKTIEFRRALDAAKMDDPEFLHAVAEAGPDPG